MSLPESPTVIVGAGFVGLFTALHLSHQRYQAPIVLIDPHDRFCFKPLLYEYLSGELDADQVVPAYTDLLQNSNITFVQDPVDAIDLNAQQVKLTSGTSYSYRNLVLALGSVAAFFAAGAQEHALPFQSKADVDALRNHLRSRLQQAAQSPDPEARRQLLTTVVVGGGPAGVELSLTLGDLLPYWYTNLGGDPQELQIVLLNHGDILSGDINSHLRETAKRAFRERSVPIDLRIGASVTAVRADAVEYQRDGQPETLPVGTVIWTAGTTVNPLINTLPLAADRRTKRGQVYVTPTLQLLDYPQVFAAGDSAVIASGTAAAAPLPATAQVAYQQGAAIAHNLKAALQGHPLKPAHVGLRGTLMKLGFDNGVANIFDRYEIIGKAGQIIREGTYLGLLPTPVHDFKASEEWLKEEIFERHVDHRPIVQIESAN